MALVDPVAHGLTDEMGRDRVALQSVPLQQRATLGHVARLLDRRGDVEVVAPARQLEAVVPHVACERSEFCEREIGPLAGEESDGTRHCGEPPAVGSTNATWVIRKRCPYRFHAMYT